MTLHAVDRLDWGPMTRFASSIFSVVKASSGMSLSRICRSENNRSEDNSYNFSNKVGFAELSNHLKGARGKEGALEANWEAETGGE